VLAGARIHGDVSYKARDEIQIDPDARIDGRVTRVPRALEAQERWFELPLLKFMRPMLLVGLLIAGMLLYMVFPRFTARSVTTLARAPLKSLGLGTALLFSVPPVAVLLIITIIGIPVGVALAAFYAAALLVAYLVTAIFIGDRFVRALPRQWRGPVARGAALAIALVLLSFANNIPYAGVLVVLLALTAGLGAAALQAYVRQAGSRAERVALESASQT
jgi:hypothetical protein